MLMLDFERLTGSVMSFREQAEETASDDNPAGAGPGGK